MTPDSAPSAAVPPALRSGRVRRISLDFIVNLVMLTTCLAIAFFLAKGYFAPDKLTANAQTARRSNINVLPTEPVSLEGATVRGRKTASVAIEEFTDFECPFCGTLARDTLPTIMTDYVDTGKVVFAVRNLPLDRLHKSARAAASAALCADDQGRFWQMHDSLFADQRHLDSADLAARAASLSLDSQPWTRCLVSTQVSQRLSADQALATSFQITGTPTMLLGRVQSDGRVRITKRLSGAEPVATVRAVLDDLLKGSQ